MNSKNCIALDTRGQEKNRKTREKLEKNCGNRDENDAALMGLIDLMA